MLIYFNLCMSPTHSNINKMYIPLNRNTLEVKNSESVRNTLFNVINSNRRKSKAAHAFLKRRSNKYSEVPIT